MKKIVFRAPRFSFCRGCPCGSRPGAFRYAETVTLPRPSASIRLLEFRGLEGPQLLIRRRLQCPFAGRSRCPAAGVEKGGNRFLVLDLPQAAAAAPAIEMSSWVADYFKAGGSPGSRPFGTQPWATALLTRPFAGIEKFTASQVPPGRRFNALSRFSPCSPRKPA